jgi:restriction endonuclease S subunit
MVKLGDVCEFILDGTHQTPTYTDKGIKFLSSKNVTSGKIDWNNVKYIPTELHKQLHKRVAPQLNDILLAKNGTTGIAAKVDRDDIFDIYVSLALLRPKPYIDSGYLYYIINSANVKSQFNARLNGIGVPNLHLKEIKAVKIPLPPLEVQQEIAAEIEGYQKLIDGARQVVDNWKPRIEVDPEWPMVRLGDVCDVRDGTHDSPKYIQKSGYPLITSKNIKDDHISFSDVNYISKDDYDKINERSFVDDGDIIMPMIGTIGNPVIVRKDRDFAIKNVALIKFCKNPKVINQFVKELLNSKSFDEQYRKNSTGSTQKFISLGFIREIKIPLPPLAIQQEIIASTEAERKVVDGCRELIVKYEEKIKKVVDGVWGE